MDDLALTFEAGDGGAYGRGSGSFGAPGPVLMALFEKEKGRHEAPLVLKTVLAALASRATGRSSRIARGLRAGFHVAEQVVRPDAMVPPALAVLLNRGAMPDLLCRGGRPGGQRCDSNGCDCDGEMTHERFSL